MQYVNVTIITPDLIEYIGKVDKDENIDLILSDIADSLKIKEVGLCSNLESIELKNDAIIRLYYETEDELNFEED